MPLSKRSKCRSKKCRRAKAKASKYCAKHQSDEYHEGRRVVGEIASAVEGLPTAEVVKNRNEVATLRAQLDMTTVEMRRQEADHKSTEVIMDQNTREAVKKLQASLKALHEKMRLTKSAHVSAIASLNKQLSDSMAENASHTTKREMYEQRQNEDSAKLKACVGNQNECTAKWSALQQQKDKLEAVMRIEMSKHEDTLSKVVGEARKLEGDLNVTTQHAKTLESKLDRLHAESTAEIRKRDKQIEEHLATLSEYRSTVSRLEGDLRQTKEELSTMTRVFNGSKADFESRMEAIRDENKSRMESEKNRYESHISGSQKGYKERMDALNLMNTRSKSELEVAKRGNDKCYTAMSSATSNLTIHQKALESCRREQSRLSADNTEGRKKLQGEMDTIRNKLTAEMDKVSKYKDDSIASSERVATLLKSIENLKKEISTMKRSFDVDQDRASKAHDKRCAELRSEGEQALTDIKKRMEQDRIISKNAMRDMSATIDSKTKLLQKMKSEGIAREGVLSSKIDKMEGDIARHEAEYLKAKLDLEGKLEVQRRIIEKMTSDHVGLRKTIEGLKSLVGDKEKDIAAMVESHSRKMREYESRYASQEKERVALSNRTKGLTHELDQSKAEMASSARLLADANRKAGRLTEREAELAKVSAELKKTSETLRTETEGHRAYTSKYEATMKKLTDKEREVTTMRQQLDSLKARHTEVSRALSTLEGRNKNTMSQYEQCKRSESGLQQSMVVATSRSKSTEAKLSECTAARAQVARQLQVAHDKTVKLTQIQSDLEVKVKGVQDQLRTTSDKCQRDAKTCSTEIDRMSRDHDAQIKNLKNQLSENISTAAHVRQVMDKLSKDHQKKTADHMREMANGKQTAEKMKNDLRIANDLSKKYADEMNVLTRTHAAASNLSKKQIVEAEKMIHTLKAKISADKHERDNEKRLSNSSLEECQTSITQRKKQIQANERTQYMLQRALDNAKEDVKRSESRCRAQQKSSQMGYRSSIKAMAELIPPEKRGGVMVQNLIDMK